MIGVLCVLYVFRMGIILLADLAKRDTRVTGSFTFTEPAHFQLDIKQALWTTIETHVIRRRQLSEHELETEA